MTKTDIIGKITELARISASLLHGLESDSYDLSDSGVDDAIQSIKVYETLVGNILVVSVLKHWSTNSTEMIYCTVDDDYDPTGAFTNVTHDMKKAIERHDFYESISITF